jgi:hypothetical protein
MPRRHIAHSTDITQIAQASSLRSVSILCLVLRERRKITVSAPDADGVYHIDWTATFTAGAKDVILDRTPPQEQSWGGYAGLSIRFAQGLTDREATGTDGVIAFGEGDRHRGRALGIDYSGLVDGQAAGLAFLDHPDNVRHRVRIDIAAVLQIESDHFVDHREWERWILAGEHFGRKPVVVVVIHVVEVDAVTGQQDFAVRRFGEDAITTLEASDAADLTIVSESVGSSNVNIEVKDSITPVITAEGFLFDDMGYGINPAEATSETDITIIDPNHPLAAGLPAGDVAIYDEPGFMSWAEIGGDVTIVATFPFDPAEPAAIFVYEQGAILDDGTAAPAMRIGLPHAGITQTPYPVWTPQGEALFAAAIDYALGLTPGRRQLEAGDADQDLDFDQLDLLRVQIAAKYLTQAAATWGEGDWNGAPGGSPGDPPPGDRVFNQLDIIAALAPGHYRAGPYAAVAARGARDDGQTSIVYDARTGELAVDAPAGSQLTSINIDSAAGIFTGQAAQNLGGGFDNDSDNNLFKATFGTSFGSLSFGNVAQAGLSELFVLNDLTVVGSLAGGGGLGVVDLVYVPEPATFGLVLLGVASLVFVCNGNNESSRS